MEKKWKLLYSVLETSNFGHPQQLSQGSCWHSNERSDLGIWDFIESSTGSSVRSYIIWVRQLNHQRLKLVKVLYSPLDMKKLRATDVWWLHQRHNLPAGSTRAWRNVHHATDHMRLCGLILLVFSRENLDIAPSQ